MMKRYKISSCFDESVLALTHRPRFPRLQQTRYWSHREGGRSLKLPVEAGGQGGMQLRGTSCDATRSRLSRPASRLERKKRGVRPATPHFSVAHHHSLLHIYHDRAVRILVDLFRAGTQQSRNCKTLRSSRSLRKRCSSCIGATYGLTIAATSMRGLRYGERTEEIRKAGFLSMVQRELELLRSEQVLYKFANFDPFERSKYFGQSMDLGQFER